MNLVRDYDADYRRGPHARQIARALGDWNGFLAQGRDYRLIAEEPWKRRSLPFDAHFDDDFWFYFRTREEMARFRARCGTRLVMRRTEEGWRRARVPPRS